MGTNQTITTSTGPTTGATGAVLTHATTTSTGSFGASLCAVVMPAVAGSAVIAAVGVFAFVGVAAVASALAADSTGVSADRRDRSAATAVPTTQSTYPFVPDRGELMI